MEEMMTNWTEGVVTDRDVPIHFYRTGKGEKPPLVLSHGFSDNGLCWTRVAQALETAFDIVMVDARNHGKSGRAIGASADLAEDLASVISNLKLGPARVLGHSMGAGTVAYLAARHPSLVTKIVLEDPPWAEKPGNESEETAAKRRKGFKKYLDSMTKMSDDEILQMGRKQHPDWHDDEFPAWVQSNRQVGEQALAGLKYSDWRVNISKIHCPALLIYADGERDGMLKQSVVEKILLENASFRAHHIPDAGHNIRREQFELYMAAVKDFL
ncbi:MAG: pimeloyl-ACP methyl ester carboxylesterase [Candidatus Azotimanducaceae bacterium]|jgi:pimeloyl-ACP methyl ester carboxylesterase